MKDYIQITEEQEKHIREKCEGDKPYFSLEESALKNFVLQITGKEKTLLFDYEVEGETLKVSLGGLVQILANVEYRENLNAHVLVIRGVNKDTKTPEYILRELLFTDVGSRQRQAECLSEYFAPYFILNKYIKYHIPSIFRKEQKKQTLPIFYNGKSRDKYKRRAVVLCNVYTLTDDYQSKKYAKRHMEITCPSWGVRGHFRHLKNGKTVFVKPFIKGKDKENYKGKEYKL